MKCQSDKHRGVDDGASSGEAIAARKYCIILSKGKSAKVTSDMTSDTGGHKEVVLWAPPLPS